MTSAFTLEQRRVERLSVVTLISFLVIFLGPFPLTTMPYSIRFRVPLPPPEIGTGGLVRFLLAIRELAVDRFSGGMCSWRDGHPADGSPPDPCVTVLLTFDDTVNPLEVTRALDRLYDHAEAIVLEQQETEE
ncbi:MAG TPA: hypothetical protein P5164_06555 [Thermoanaerobaculia bacterium]|nr:hypothetical protein [Thermoanaerobaculia bacterium]